MDILKNLKTSNNFIKARYEITEQELKLIFAIYNRVQFTLDNKDLTKRDIKKILSQPFEFTSQEISFWLAIEKNQYQNIKSIVKRLMTRTVSIEDDDNKEFKITTFCNYAEYKVGILKIQPNENLINNFIDLKKNFTKLPIATLLQFKNVYAIKIFNLMVEYKDIKDNFKLDLDDFKKFLKIENKYRDSGTLKRDVLEKVKKEINTVVKNIKFDYILEREGRTYKYIAFTYNIKALEEHNTELEFYVQAIEKYKKICNYGEVCNFDNKDRKCYYCKQIYQPYSKIKLQSKK